MNKRLFITILLVFLGIVGVCGGIFFGLRLRKSGWELLSPIGSKVEVEEEKPLVKYEMERLKERGGIGSEIVLERVLRQAQDNFTSYLFSYISEGRKITGLVNIPDRGLKSASTKQGLPVIVMLRGWVDLEMYETGVGTQKAGEVFAQNGYLTLAPDYLGYGESDMPPDNVWEERFLRNVSIIDLLASISPSTPSASLRTSSLRADPNRIGIWGHSNGGLSALTALEITGRNYPTSLWAPVSQFFPYDILYYTWEYDDKGRVLRKSLAEFEAEYDVDKYSFDEYLDWISASIQLHQGIDDPYIPVSWSESLVERLGELGNEVKYYTYLGAGHQMEGSWDLVVRRDLKFFGEKL